jgi:hypothetical protein
MRKNADNIVPILQEFETKKEHHQKTIEKDTKKVRKVLYAIVDDTIQQNKLEIRKLSRDNLINILINSPQQDIQIALKKTREIENKHLTTQPEHERIESNETQETLFEKEKKRISQLIYFPTHFSEAAPTKDIPEIPYSTTCQIFYYEEDYYDAVSRQTLLIDISQNTIKFSDNDVKIFTKDDIVQNKI